MATKKPQVQLRKPPSVPANADAFVASAQTSKLLDFQTLELPDVQDAKRSDAPKPVKPMEIQARLLTPEAFKPSSVQTSRRPVLRRQDGRELRKMTLYLTPDVASALAIRAAQSGLDMSEIVNSALEEWLAR